ncbi:hypothetical protein RHMOL_Rhmol09G0056600 [Rhododendron molle]|uniref:Uncharacterized protein n=1 Tax=Rhododendron molle TaxID=49168 RepID=A0ACC0MAH8_RHOML|nr:hypothetical protein RHMOL_Rhmol09G0056600 [Rhododendron molle]
MAAPDSSINNHELHYSVNVKGTKNVIDACIELKVKRLIYTSSPTVVFDGIHGIFNGDESLPYPTKHIDSYSATKAEGEALVIKSNGINGLLTCCIRPSSIFGPGDKLLVPSLVFAARAGKSKFIIGDGNNMYDFTYVENVAHAHICAERALASEGTVAEKAAREAYFITNMEPIKFWEFVSLVLEGLGYERPRIKIPVFVVMPIARLVERTYKLLAPHGMKVPQIIPSRIRLISCSKTFDCSKANDRLGYTPIVPFQDGLRRTIESYSHLRAECRPKKDGPSKSSICLGRGLDMQSPPSASSEYLLPLRSHCQGKPQLVMDPSASVAANSHWGLLPSRSPNHIRHPGPKHHGPGPTTGVLPALNGIQPLFVPAAVNPPMSFPAPVALPPVSSKWPVVPPPRHPLTPRPPVPGTGVFLPPPSSGNSTETSFSGKATVSMDKDSGLGKPNGSSSVSLKGQVDGKMPRKECNGSVDGIGGANMKAADKPGGTV